MTNHDQPYLRLLEQREALLGALAAALQAAQSACIARDLEQLRAHTGEQERLCAQWQTLDAEIEKLEPRPTGSRPRMAADQRIHEALQRVARAQGELRRVNSAHQILLRRCKRNLQALANLYQRFAPSYALDPAAAEPLVGARFEERV